MGDVAGPGRRTSARRRATAGPADTKRPTLADVAALAGVSRTTASFVLNGRDDMRISPDAAARVRAAADTIGYRPNALAKALRSARTHTIALLSDSITTEQYGGQMVRGALDTAVAHGHQLIIVESGGDRRLEQGLVRELLDRKVEGFLIAAEWTHRITLPDDLDPAVCVLINCFDDDRRSATFLPDELQGGHTAARALLDAGHRRDIVLVGERAPDVYAARQRVAGMEAELSAAGLRFRDQLECTWWPQTAHAAVSAWLDAGNSCSAMVCMNDRVAFGAYQALQERGLQIPLDVSVISFDNSTMADWLRPGLTSVAIPHLEMGRRAALHLVSPEVGTERPPQVELDMPLVERGSLGPPRSR